MVSNMEEISPLMAHYFTGPDRKNTQIGIPYTTANDGVSLSLYIMEVAEKFLLEENIVGITIGGGGNLWVL